MAGSGGRSGWIRAAALVATTGILAAACAPHPPTRYQPEHAGAPYSEVVLTRGDGVVVAAADPDILKVGDTWYMYPTSAAESGLEAWSSTDLTSWTYEGFVWSPTPGSWNDRGSYWAPDLYESSDGNFYMYYSAGQKIGVARSDSPVGPFEEVFDHPLVGSGYGGVGDGRYFGTETDPVPLLDSDENAIDAFLFEASDGSLTLYFSSYPVLGIAVLSAIPMINETTPAPGPAVQVLDAKPDTWELFIREAPWVTEHDGIYHLTYSGAGANTTCYSIGEATATSPLGPFTRSSAAPILHDDPAVGFYGPGHHTITETPDREPVMFLHTKDDYEPGYERHVRWAPVSYDAQGFLQLEGTTPGRSTTGSSSCAFG